MFYKHVPIQEDFPFYAIKTIIYGTHNVVGLSSMEREICTYKY